MQSFGKKLKELREGLGWTQADLSQKAGISRTSLARMETDVQVPSWPAVVDLARALGVSCEAFPTTPRSQGPKAARSRDAAKKQAPANGKSGHKRKPVRG